MMRQSVDGDFRANLTRGGEAIPYQIDDDIEWIAGVCKTFRFRYSRSRLVI